MNMTKDIYDELCTCLTYASYAGYRCTVNWKMVSNNLDFDLTHQLNNLYLLPTI